MNELQDKSKSWEALEKAIPDSFNGWLGREYFSSTDIAGELEGASIAPSYTSLEHNDSRKSNYISMQLVHAKPKSRSEDDVCKVYFCMKGRVIGNSGGKECRAAEKEFFKIIKFKNGKFSPSATFNLRKRFLGGCTTADPKYVKKILSSFGKMLLKK